MGFKGLMSDLGMNPFGLVSLVLCFASFLAILLWTGTRSRHEIERQSRLWEDDE
jgi:cbb3-type cytochrome oxidase subunit 3